MYKQLKKDKGFTIIEVMIVLAIAGLILLIVFLAVPALQRNARNTTIKNDASAISASITEFESNNSGTLPTSFNGNASEQGPTITVGKTGTVQSQAKIQGSTAAAFVATYPTSLNTSTVDLVLGYTCGPGGGLGPKSPRAVAVYYGIDTASGPSTTPGCIDS